MGGHHTKIVGGDKEHSGGAIPEDFPEVTEALEKVCLIFKEIILKEIK